VVAVGSEPVWVEPGDEALAAEVDPRVLLRSVLNAGDGPPGCETQRDPSSAGDIAAATGWQYVGLEDVAGRPTHHVTCSGGDIWIDIESRLILRTKGPAVDDAGQPIPVEITEVTEITFGEQPAAVFAPPDGVTRMSLAAYLNYICARDLPNEIIPGISDCPSQEAEATPPPDTTPPPEPSPTPMPTPPGPGDCPVPPSELSEPLGPLAWTPERLNEDWPAPVRPEAAGGESVQPMPRTFLDPRGDNGSTAHPCVDISWVMADTSEVHLKLVANTLSSSMSAASNAPVVDPTEQWIAYGVVFDDDRDGVPDRRVGKENTPGTVAGWNGNNRVWITDLHTGRTVVQEGDYVGEVYVGAYFHGRFSFGFDTTNGGGIKGTSLVNRPLYLWASVIQDGRVVATDYAPDVGWLDTSLETTRVP
jgi:hypothetical protein